MVTVTCCVAVARSQNIDGAILREAVADWICVENIWIKVTNIIISNRKKAPIFWSQEKRQRLL